MKVGELIRKLNGFDTNLEVQACLEEDGTLRLFYIDINQNVRKGRRSESGGIQLISRNDPDGVEFVCLQLDENHT